MNSTAFPHFVCAAISSAFLFSFSISVRADALDNWTTNQVSTNGFRLNCVIYGNGRYVVAGGWADGGFIMSSEDGLNWTTRADGGFGGPPSLVWALAYGGGRFVTVGHFGGTASSTNGIDWEYGHANSIGLYGVAFGAGRFVAVGDGILQNTVNSIFTSTNGITWTVGTKAPSEVRDVWDVAYGAGKFVAVANGGYSYISTNGTSWVRSNIPPGGIRISYCNGRFIIPFVSVGTNLISLDGVSWIQTSTGLSSGLGKVIYANGVYVASVSYHAGTAGVHTNLATSVDGTNWIQRSFPSPSLSPYPANIASDGIRFFAVGHNGGTPFGYYNAKVFRSEPVMGIGITSPPLQIILSGVVGRPYRVEYLPSLPASATNTWQTLTNLILPSSPYFVTDPVAPNSIQRYYRAVLLP